MKSMGNGAYSALYIINAVLVSKEFELSRFYCILNCTINYVRFEHLKNFTYQFSYLYNDDCKL